MPSGGHDEVHNYSFADKALALRQRSRLTQRELGALLGVHVKTIGGWEEGLFYPSPERLQQLVALYLKRGALEAGREAEEAGALWEAARQSAPRRLPPFDPHWFAALQGEPAGPAPPPSLVPATGLSPRLEWREAPAATALRHDWGEAPAAAALWGRTEELALLAGWVREEGSRVVEVVGMGGIGKTALVARLAHGLAPQFPVVYWRSLRNAPPVEEWLAGAISALSAGQAVPPEGLEARLGLVMELLREQRALLVLDNLETILEAGAPTVHYGAGYEGYGEALRRLAEGGHRGCLLLTSREQPLRADEPAVRALRLGGLGVEDVRALLGSRGLEGDEAAWGALVGRYGGNPLALKVVGETIEAVFEGDLASFLAQEAAVFGDIRALLDEQVTRLSPLERAVAIWLAVEREPVGFAELAADVGPGVARGPLLEAVEGLRRRSLLEAGSRGAFTLQPVVLEYTTDRLVVLVEREVLAGEPELLVSHALVKATARDYVRRSQERLIGEPLLAQLDATSDSAAVGRRLLALLDGWRGRGREEQGYGPGNVVNLLRLLRGDLRGLDLSHLAIRQAYLAEAEAQDASLAHAHLEAAVLAEPFTFPSSVVLSADGAFLAAGTSTGEVRLWRVADRTPLLAVPGHSGMVGALALSADGGLLASGSVDGTLRLWEAPSGRPLATLQGHSGPVHRVALSADGGLVASGGMDGMVRLWEAPNGRPLATLQGHTGAVWHVALSGDGRLVASGGSDRTVRLWEAPSGRPMATLQGNRGEVNGVALSADGGLLASGGQDGTVKLWEAPGGQLLAALQGHTGGIHAVALSADGALLASGSEDWMVRLWEASSGRPLATLQGHTGGVWVALSGDGRVVASGGFDDAVKLWEAPTGRLFMTLHGHAGGVYGVALSDDGTLLATIGMDGMIKLWEAPGGRLLATLAGHSGPVLGVALSADGRLLASGGFDGTVRLWEAPSGRLLATLQGHSGPVRCVALSGDGGLLASGGADGTMHLWEAPRGQPLATLQAHTGGVYEVALSGDGGLLASGGADGTLRLWAMPSGELLATLRGHTGPVRGVALAWDGQVVASGGYDGTVRLWEVSSGACLRVVRPERRYERLAITGLTGVTGAQRTALLALGAVEGTT